MDISQVVEIATAGAGQRNVAIGSLERVDIATDMVGSLSQILSELIQNASAFSSPDQPVTVNGEFDGADYLVSVSDDGVGIPDAMLDALNSLLESPGSSIGDPNVGISLVARLASRAGIGVELVARDSGTTARVAVPERSVTGDGQGRPMVSEDDVFRRPDPDPARETIDLSRLERKWTPRPQQVINVSEFEQSDVEAFLEGIFGPLRGKIHRREQPPKGMESNGSRSRMKSPPISPRPSNEATPSPTTTLRVRVPGENFSVVDDSRSTTSSEGAIDIRTALTKFQSGRRDARDR